MREVAVRRTIYRIRTLAPPTEGLLFVASCVLCEATDWFRLLYSPSPPFIKFLNPEKHHFHKGYTRETACKGSRGGLMGRKVGCPYSSGNGRTRVPRATTLPPPVHLTYQLTALSMVYNLDGMKLITRRREEIVDVPRMFAFLLGVLAVILLIEMVFAEEKIRALFHALNAATSAGLFAWKY